MSDLVGADRTEALAAYADRHGLFDLLQRIVARLVVARPAEPFQFIIDQLQKPRAASILIIGPPSSGQKSIAEALARTFDAVHVHSGSLLRSAMERQTSNGMQAKAYVDRGHLVPDTIVTSVVLARLLDEPDVAERGFVLEGFPRTREQAVAMLRRGLIPEHVIVFDIPDDLIIARAIGLRHDPVTGRTYHLKYDPPPRNALIESRLTKRATDTEPATRARLRVYHRNIDSVLSCFKGNVRRFSYPKGIATQENIVFSDVYDFLGTTGITNAPRCQKIIVAGLPGSGKTSVAEAIEKKYGYVHVSPKKVILEEIDSGSHWGSSLAQYVNCAERAPSGFLVELISSRLKKKDCIDRGWILDGFPLSRADADALKAKGVVPNRLIWLETPDDVCAKRLTARRYDPVSGRVVNLESVPKDLAKADLSTWVSRPEDSEEEVDRRIREQQQLKSELEKAYGYRKTEDSPGIMYVVKAEGLGERDPKKDAAPFDRVLELVEGSLLRPIPIDIRADY
ncbi:hypothetical protein HK105_206561 [Polyrhizophydium stewartii]|uniref:Adenylate kinase n=1 Tax=Polyrhizophydium stewartii TaxID=2732419 RepID=A0ABR4N3B4_9FUNG|nr:Adenylate kinase 8 [Polyrhizophydium stewartii]